MALFSHALSLLNITGCVFEDALFQGLSQITGCVPEDAVQEVHQKAIRLSCHRLPFHNGF